MGNPRGFLEHDRVLARHRPVSARLRDWEEVNEELPVEELHSQAARCMDCGIPFCNSGCPLGNVIPDWNHLVYKGRWYEASERLHATNNFPEFTGRLCPAPCEGACVLGINDQAVTIKQVEIEIVERAFSEGWVEPKMAATSTGKKVAVVGSGPAGLAAAQQLTRAGHDVVVYERANRIGGLLRYGIPEFKMEKRVLDRRLAQMRQEGTHFRVNANIGENVPVADLLDGHDAVVLTIGSTVPRDLPVPGRELDGIHFAMEYLTWANRVQEGDIATSPINAEGKHVIVIGGGDTGADCLGTAHRQGAKSVHQLEIMPKPPAERDPWTNPWPMWPAILRTSSAHEEGGERLFSVTTTEFVDRGGGDIAELRGHEVDVSFDGGRPNFAEIDDTDFTLRADLVLLAMGFTGPQQSGLVEGLGLDVDARGNIARDENWMASTDGVFVAGDGGRGQSLIVWAIAEGRSVAAAVDRRLMGETTLPAPLTVER